MPIYEYKCNKCSTDFSVLKLGSGDDAPTCPTCGTKDVSKKLSSFSCSASSGFSGGGSVSAGGG